MVLTNYELLATAVSMKKSWMVSCKDLGIVSPKL